jgi:hypothetical protein
MGIAVERAELPTTAPLRVRAGGDARNALTAFDRSGQAARETRRGAARGRIRCPVCFWQPPRSSVWCCLPMGSPEFFAGGCGHAWNTFTTRGRCPGCNHQWRHTTCLRCQVTSRHEDWYATPPGAGASHGH